jgi:hypothetical protein
VSDALTAGGYGEGTTEHAAANERQSGKHPKRGRPEDQRPHLFNLASLGISSRLTTAAVMTFTLCIVGPTAHRCAQRPSKVHQRVTEVYVGLPVSDLDDCIRWACAQNERRLFGWTARAIGSGRPTSGRWRLTRADPISRRRVCSPSRSSAAPGDWGRAMLAAPP